MSEALKNEIHAYFGALKTTTTAPVSQWAYGQKLIVHDADLPSVFEAYYSNSRSRGEAKPQIGTDGEAPVPDEYFLSGADIYVFLMEHEGADDGRYRKIVHIPIDPCSQPSDVEPSPVQQNVIDQAIAALNTAVTQTGEDKAATAALAEAAAASSLIATEAAQSAQGSATSASASAFTASTAAATATQKANEAATSATNAANAKTAAETAQGKAEAAQTASESAQASAQSAAQTATAKASEASTSATSASGSATAASASAFQASESATAASASATAAAGSATTASTKASEASASATAANTAKTAAQTAQTAAETAQGKAEDAQAAAETAAATFETDTTLTVSGKAADAKATGDEISELKEDLSDVVVHQNLFDKSKIIQGGYFNGSGGISNNENSYYNPQYIPVESGVEYTYTAGNTASPYYIATYDSAKNFVARVNPTGTSYTPNSGIVYIRFSIYNQEFKSNFKFAKATDYPTASADYNLLNGEKLVNAPYSPIITESVTTEDLNKSIMSFEGNYYPDGNGSKTALATQYWYEFTALNNFEIWCDPNVSYPDIFLAHYNGSAERANFIARYRKNSSQDTLPKADSKLSVTAGQTIVISVTSDANFSFLSSGIKTGTVFIESVQLNQSQIDSVSEKIHVALYDNLYVISVRDIKINFRHTVHTGNRADLWNFDGITKNGNAVIASATDIIGVLRENGESDFMGGVHGDETIVDFHILADGVPVTTEVDCNNVDILMTSNLTRVSTGDNIVKRIVHIFIDKEKIEIETTFTSLIDNLQVYRAYCGGMFAWYEDERVYATSNLGELIGTGSTGVDLQTSHDLYTATIITNGYTAICENLIGMNTADSYGNAFYYGNETRPRTKMYLGALKDFTMNSGDSIKGKSRYIIR